MQQQPDHYQKYFNAYFSQAPVQQFVIINNQMVPVYTVSPPINMNPQINPAPNVIYQPPPDQDGKNPFNVVYQPIQGTPVIPQPNAPPVAQVPTSGSDEYTHNVICYVVIYLILFAGCIGVQFGLYGSKTAAALWITSYVLLLVTMVWFYIVKHQTLLWLLIVQLVLLVLSFIFEIAAFAMAVSHPVLYNYQTDVSPSDAQYNNRILQTDYIYTYDQCWQYYLYSSPSDYQYYYSMYCDGLLGFTNTTRTDYETCQQLYDQSYYTYQLYYGVYCDPILGYSSGSGYYYSEYEFCYYAYYYYDYETYDEYYGLFCDQYAIDNYTDYYDDDYYNEGYYYDSENQCIQNGFYNPYREYCFPLQYGMMAYAVINLVAYLILFGVLLKRIIVQIRTIKSNQKTGILIPFPQQQPLEQNQNPTAF